MFVGMSAKGGTFGTYLGDLKRTELTDEQGGALGVTEGGFELSEAVPGDIGTAAEILHEWSGKFRSGARKMLDVIVEAYPQSLTRDEVADAVEMSPAGGTFGTYLGDLRRSSLVEVQGGEVRLADFVGELT